MQICILTDTYIVFALKRHHPGGGDLGRGCGLFLGTGRLRLELTPTLSDQVPVRVLVCSLYMNRL